MSSATDLFVPGVVIYWLVSGTHPYPEAQPHHADGPRLAGEYREGVPRSLELFLA